MSRRGHDIWGCVNLVLGLLMLVAGIVILFLLPSAASVPCALIEFAMAVLNFYLAAWHWAIAEMPQPQKNFVQNDHFQEGGWGKDEIT